jgi:hypothetical protein
MWLQHIDDYRNPHRWIYCLDVCMTHLCYEIQQVCEVYLGIVVTEQLGPRHDTQSNRIQNYNDRKMYRGSCQQFLL